MKTRAQIFSLDLVISMILVVLAIGTTLQYVELSNYAAKDAELMRNLEWIAVAASDVLVGSDDIVCEVAAGTESFHLNNCIVRNTSFTGLTKAKMGIPDDYGCRLEFDGNPVPPCNTIVPATATNVFGVERKVVVTTNPLTKAEFDNCISGACGGKLSEATIKLKVWKA